MNAPLNTPETHLRALNEVEEQLESLHQRLIDRPGDIEATEEARASLLARRRVLALDLYGAIANLLADGGEVLFRCQAVTIDNPPESRAAPEGAAPRPTPARSPEQAEPAPSGASLAPSAPLAPATPPVEAVEPAPPPSPAATAEHLRALGRRFSHRPTVQPLRARPSRRADLSTPAALLKTLGASPSSDVDELGRLQQVVARLDELLPFSQDMQREFISLITTRARALQDRSTPEWTHADALSTLFTQVSRWSGQHRPGWVYGLAREHGAPALGWLAAAKRTHALLEERVEARDSLSPERLLNRISRLIDDGAEPDELRAELLGAVGAGLSSDDPRLVRMLDPYLADLKVERRFKKLRRAIRDARKADAQEAATETPDADADRPVADKLRGKRMAIVGGEARESARQRIQAAFDLAECRWVPSKVREVQALVQSVDAGKIDVVVLLNGFIGHWVDDHLKVACDRNKLPRVNIGRGYGVSRIREALAVVL